MMKAIRQLIVLRRGEINQTYKKLIKKQMDIEGRNISDINS